MTKKRPSRRAEPTLTELIEAMNNASATNARIAELESQLAALKDSDPGRAYAEGYERGVFTLTVLFSQYVAPLVAGMTRAQTIRDQIAAAVLAGRGNLQRQNVSALLPLLAKALGDLDIAYANAEPALLIAIDRTEITTFYELAKDYASEKTNDRPLLDHIAATGADPRLQWRTRTAPGREAYAPKWFVAKLAIEQRADLTGENRKPPRWDQVIKRMTTRLRDKMRLNTASDLEREAYELLTGPGATGYVRRAVSEYEKCLKLIPDTLA